MMPELEEIVSALNALPERGRGCRYPTEMKEQIGRYIAQQRAAGVTWTRLSAALSIPTNTLRRWHGDGAAATSPDAAVFLPVRVREACESVSGLTLESRDGWCVRGLSLADVARLLSHRA